MNQPDTELVDEQLTAYLDGELTPQESAALEQSLVSDEKLRLRLADLRKAYDLLDEIPETPHNQRFTKSTMELVIKDLTNSASPVTRNSTVHPVQPDWLTWPRFLILFAGMLSVGSLVAFAVNQMMRYNELGNLGVYAGIRGLQDVSDLDIAVRLSQETEIMNILKERFGESLVPPPPNSTWERKDWLQELTPIQTSRLNSGKDMLQKMDASTRARWTALESKIEARPDSKQIQETTHLVGMAIKASVRDELEVMNREERFAYLRKELCFQAAIHYTLHMTPSDAKALSDWNTNSLNTALIQENPNSRWNETQMLLGRMLFLKNRFERQGELIDELLPTLSKTGAKILEGITNDDEQLLTLFFWLFPERFPSEQATLELYEKFDSKGRMGKENRQRIDLGDPHEFVRNLEAMRARP